QLPKRFCQSNGRIGGSGPRSLEILLIHHGRRCLAPPVLPVMPLDGLGSGGAVWPRESHLGGWVRLCESRFRYLRLPDTGHGRHSRDNVDFSLFGIAKTIAILTWGKSVSLPADQGC